MAKKLKEVIRKTPVIVGSSIKAATKPEDTPSQMQAYNAPFNENELPADVSLPWKMDELATRLHKHYGKNVNQHSRTVSTYTAGDSKDINHALWTRHTTGNSEYRNHMPSMIDNHIGNLHDMTTSQKTPEPLTVHSKVEYDPREKMNSKGIVHHPAFMSTSIDPKYVKKFRANGDEHHMLSIDLPKGSPGAYIGGVSEYPEEREFLLPKGQNIKIHRTENHFERHPVKGHMINYHTHYATIEHGYEK